MKKGNLKFHVGLTNTIILLLELKRIYFPVLMWKVNQDMKLEYWQKTELLTCFSWAIRELQPMKTIFCHVLADERTSNVNTIARIFYEISSMSYISNILVDCALQIPNFKLVN